MQCNRLIRAFGSDHDMKFYHKNHTRAQLGTLQSLTVVTTTANPKSWKLKVQQSL